MTREEAIKAVKAWDFLNNDEKEVIETLIPELADSEDERIRKWIINEIKIKHHNLDEDNVDFVDKAIAWLEKQGNKPFDYDNANIQQKDFAPKSQRIVLEEAKEALYGKPTWSEEDEKMYLSIMSVLLSTIGTDKTGFTVTKEVNWLKSIKERVQSLSQPKGWSEEDKRMHQYVVNDLRFVKELVNDPHYVVSVERVEKEIDWMESLKERIGG